MTPTSFNVSADAVSTAFSRFYRKLGPAVLMLCASLLATACSDESTPVSGDASTLSADANMDVGAVVDVAGDTGPADTGPADSSAADVGAGDTNTADVPVIKQACTNNDECTSGSCLPTPEGRFCADSCVSSCPVDYACKEVLTGSDVVYVCAHKSPYRCRPCANDSDCDVSGKSAGGVCVQLDGGGFCTEACGKNSGKTGDCIGEGFTCKAAKDLSGGDTEACLPDSGSCPCPDGKKGFCNITNDHGTCPGSYTCQNDKAGKCAGQVPAAES